MFKWLEIPLTSLDGTEISILELTMRSRKASVLKGYYVRFSRSLPC